MSFVRGEKCLETINLNHFESKHMKVKKKERSIQSKHQIIMFLNTKEYLPFVMNIFHQVFLSSILVVMREHDSQ
jgi:hypothetical protein